MITTRVMAESGDCTATADCASCPHREDRQDSGRCTPGDVCVRAMSGRQIARFFKLNPDLAEQVAGFTEALRESLPLYDTSFNPAIDWAAYAGKKRQLPWFLLAALIVSGRSYRIPDRAVELYGVTDGEEWRETWEMLFRPGSVIKRNWCRRLSDG